MLSASTNLPTVRFEGEREIDGRGLETLVLIKSDDGAWRIRHSHTSSRPRRAQ